MSQTVAIQGGDIANKFVALVQWARGGSMIIVTPFINDFQIGTSAVSARIMNIVRMQSSVDLLVAPPTPGPHKTHTQAQVQSCYHCGQVAAKIKLLDRYEKFVQDLLIKEGLHAKVYVASSQKGIKRCLTGSVNLTQQGFYQHCEIGIYTSDSSIIHDILGFISIWKSGRSGPRAERYRIWRRQYLKRYPHLKHII